MALSRDPAAGTASTSSSTTSMPKWPDSATPVHGSATTSSQDRAASRSCCRTPRATWSNSSNPPSPARHDEAPRVERSSIEGDTMAKQALPTRALLACGAVAGPIYVTVTMAQALTRDGFDLRQHRFSWLTTGDLGWIHQSNMLLVGVLTVLLAVGVRQMMPTGRGAVWGPRLLALVGVAYIVGGLLTGDRVA